MKVNFIFASLVVAIFASCSSNNQPKDGAESCCANAYSPASLTSAADSLVDDTIWIEGTAKHVCCCSKKKLMLADENDTTVAALRVMAGGEIDTFSKALVGQHVKLQGVLRLNKITMEDLQSQLSKFDSLMAAEPKAEMEEKGESKKHCSMGGIAQKKKNAEEKIQWLKDNNKEFIADYYVESVKFADCCKSKNTAEGAETEQKGETKSCCSGK